MLSLLCQRCNGGLLRKHLLQASSPSCGRLAPAPPPWPRSFLVPTAGWERKGAMGVCKAESGNGTVRGDGHHRDIRRLRELAKGRKDWRDV